MSIITRGLGVGGSLVTRGLGGGGLLIVIVLAPVRFQWNLQNEFAWDAESSVEYRSQNAFVYDLTTAWEWNKQNAYIAWRGAE